MLFLIGLLVSTSYSQNKSDTDSLYQVKKYLLAIKSTVNVKDWNGDLQLKNVGQLIEKGKAYETQFPIWLKTVINEDSWHYTEMKRQFNLILQTLALYKSDLMASPNKRPTHIDDLDFLNSSIPRLIDAINYSCKLAEEERLKKTH